MRRSITIINTEIQLINAIEALNHLECTENYLIIGQFNTQTSRIKKIENMLKEPLFRQHFKKIIHLPLYLSNKNPLRFLGYILAYIKFFFFILFSKKFDFCFFGVVTDIIVKPIVFLTQHKNSNCTLCVIDEGIRVLEDAKERVQHERQLLVQEESKTTLIQGYYKAITRRWLYPKLTYFSIYQLPLLKDDILIKNEYLFFKHHKLPSVSITDHAIVIVGQPYAELGFTKLGTYQQIITQIINTYKNHTIYYAPHPIETMFHQWLPNNIVILRTTYPLELVLISNSVETILGFASSVLFNCASMKLCKNIISISLDENEYINMPNKSQLEELNKRFNEYNIQIISSKTMNI
jgi:hypothetical protein